MLQDKILDLLFVFAAIAYYNQGAIQVITQQEKGLAYVQQVLSFNDRSHRQEEFRRQIIFFRHFLFLDLSRHYIKKWRAALVTYFNLFRRYFVEINNILPGLFTDCNDLIRIAAGVQKFFPVYFYVNRVIMPGISLRHQVVNGDHGLYTGFSYSDAYFIAQTMVHIYIQALQILFYPATSPGRAQNCMVKTGRQDLVQVPSFQLKS